jgi:GH24 family phage-related lysozyme (muramidase)
MSSQADQSASGYALRVIQDTWLTLRMTHSSALTEEQKQFLRAGDTYPISGVQSVNETDLRITFGADITGTLQLRGYDTWYVPGSAVQILRNGQPVSLAQVVSSAPSSTASSMATYTLRIAIDTWLKQSTAQGSTLPDNQRQFVSAGTVVPLSTFKQVENDHILVTLGVNQQGNQIFFQGRNTWYVYRLAAQVLRDGQVVLGLMNPPPAPAPAPAPTPAPAPVPPAPAPTASPYTVQFLSDTWLKQSTVQGSTLPDDQRQFIDAGTILPIAAYTSAPANHLTLTLGTNSQGQQVQFKGRNTWLVYRPTVQILREGRPIDSATPTPSPSGTRQINAAGLRLLKSFEGLRLRAYQDAVGVWTIGYGTTAGVRPGQVITEAQAEALLKRDLNRFEAAVEKLVAVPLNDNQFSALVSFAYNVGEGALSSSTLLNLLNRKEYQEAANQFLRWNRAGGMELAGLTRRRRAERALFLGQDYTVFL